MSTFLHSTLGPRILALVRARRLLGDLNKVARGHGIREKFQAIVGLSLSNIRCYVHVSIYNHPEVDRISGISQKKVRQNTLDRISKWHKNPGRWLEKTHDYIVTKHIEKHVVCV